jgi:hypothetical protein
MRSTIVVFLAFVALAVCDLYMHNPRGSNDRLNEANANRDNANRLFDSQNNAKGGYCWGPAMTYYEGSQLSVEWTNQHGCGSNPKLVCNIVVQYICSQTSDPPTTQVRDGTTTNTIPDTTSGPTALDGNGNLLYGMHEPYQYYQDCQTRNRNMGLFISDRATQGGLTAGRASSIYTRQNNNGQTFGYECPEERDYYPYWHPSPWRDIAIMSFTKDYCDFYVSQSENVLGKGYCNNNGVQAAPNNQNDCVNGGYQWQFSTPSGIPAPDCISVPWSRENHLGNGVTGFTNSYNMTMPRTGDHPCIANGNCACVIRLRYNVSSIEQGYPSMSRPDAGFIDYNQNGANSPVSQNTVVNDTQNNQLDLALDTTQYGRTFEDRSFVFGIQVRPSGIAKSSRIFNLNVRGKRGNIVQTYPGTEYDFVPQYLYTRVGDWIHFQWTGCDTNPAGNAGEGTDQTDRSNAVQMQSASNAYPITDAWAAANPKQVLFTDGGFRLRMSQLGQTGCVTAAAINAAGGNSEEDVRNCGKLNAASQYFNGGIVKMNQTGTFYYMSTRNHNFTNRDQKGIIYVTPLLPPWAMAVVIIGGVLFAVAAAVAGLMFYAKSHPHSTVSTVFSRM